MKARIKLGCDPELFLIDVTGKLRASCDKVGGSKHDPQPLVELGDGYAVQEDNVAIEFNIPPAESAQQYVESVKKTMLYLGEGMKKMHGFTIVNLSAASFPKDELQHPASQVFGCDPDFNAWTLRKNPRPHAEDPNLRSCGGHVHVGIQGDVDPIRLIRCMDLFLGVPSVLMDKGELRKELYGKAGAFRTKDYGVEYRTLSNFWVFDDRLVKWVWDNTEKAVEAVESQFAIDNYKDSILDAINNNNKEAARFLINECQLELMNV
jgi:hypothetical protein